jgi:DNA repair protein RAD5
MEPILLRRTKDLKDETGQNIISLPPKTIITEYLEFSPKEQELYDAITNVIYHKTVFQD